MRSGMGMGALGLSSLLGGASLNPLNPKAPHFRPRAKRIIHLFMNGGPSHVDTFDPKPMLQKHAGKMLPMPNLPTERKTGAAFGSPYSFSKYGQSGLPVSEIFPHTARHMDDICVLRSMRADVPNHEPSLMLMNCGESIQVRPSMGSWLTYGLGTENQNLPGFIAMCPGYPIQESQNWQCGFLPGSYQGTYIDTRKKDVDELIQHIRNPHLSLGQQRRQLDLLRKINERHAKDRQNEPQLEARIHSFELAYRMQMEATDAFDISREPEHIRKAYGSTTQARQILIARRLIERGVRYVQVWHGNSQPWDNHDDIEKGHRFLAKQCDQAIGALLSDLKQRGLLEDTIVMWGGEFGRTPTVELPKPGSNAGKINGRDHNHHGFSMWLAGGGVRGGMAYGATDEFGFKAVENVVHVHDLHATILHLMGFDHEQLTFRHAGRDFRLTDVHGHVVHDIIS
ncbi:MAG: sulfatase [Verrucomicrobiales bacterium]|nr:sulfatase [Verrucomicrobiales bacterium]